MFSSLEEKYTTYGFKSSFFCSSEEPNMFLLFPSYTFQLIVIEVLVAQFCFKGPYVGAKRTNTLANNISLTVHTI